MTPPGGPFDAELFALFQELTGALIQYPPAHFKNIHCTIRPAGSAELSYEIFCPAFPDEGTTKPNARVAGAAEALRTYWVREGALFPGVRVELTQQPDGQWKNRVENLEFAERPDLGADGNAADEVELPPAAKPWWKFW